MLKITFAEGVEPSRKLTQRARNEGTTLSVKINKELERAQQIRRPDEVLVMEDATMIFAWSNNSHEPVINTKYQGKL